MIETDEVLAPGAAAASARRDPTAGAGIPADAAAAWRTALPLLLATIAAILGIYWRTAESIVSIWWRSETFAHGFLIVPISLYLIWGRRSVVARIVPRPDLPGFAVLGAAGLMWLAAAAGNVQVVQQFALVLMICGAVVAVAGRDVARSIAFPLGFLFFGVPFGEALIPPLMDWTADFTVTALRLTGIPVYREGTFFTIPSGNWSVVEGCSGLRYLIASITVGALFAYLNYRKTSKRLSFVAASIIVPIIANGFRAYMIVMIAHLSDMRLALGVDHLVYGWVFFGIVMLLLFWVGSYWRDDDEPATARDARESSAPSGSGPSAGLAVPAAAAAVALAAAWPLYAAYLDQSIEGRGAVHLAVPAPAQGWTLETAPITDWVPHYEGAAASVLQAYRSGNSTVLLYLGYYRQQRRGAELVTSTNLMVVQKHLVWSNVGESARREDLGRGESPVRQTLLRSLRQRLLIWDAFRIGGRDLSSPYVAKMALARDKLLGRGDDAVAVIVATPYEEPPDAAAATLRRFLHDMAPSIDAAIAGASGAASGIAAAGAAAAR